MTALPIDRPRKRTIVLGGRPTSVSLEDAFWRELKRLARVKQCTVNELVASVELERKAGSRASSLRIAILEAVMAEAGALDG